ncbi:MAG: tRNA lysidine(34) synthetase TilS, partial [Gemmatimonadales bacterium]
ERGSALFGAFRITWQPARMPDRLARGGWTTWIPRGAWTLRTPAPGDALVPLGGVGHRPLRRLLMEARVPRAARACYPVVTSGAEAVLGGEGDATILWVPGICRSADGVPAPGTEAVRLDVTEHGSAAADGRP